MPGCAPIGNQKKTEDNPDVRLALTEGLTVNLEIFDVLTGSSKAKRMDLCQEVESILRKLIQEVEDVQKILITKSLLVPCAR